MLPLTHQTGKTSRLPYWPCSPLTVNTDLSLSALPRYERIPKKIRDIANYTVICKNIGHFDRLFRCYYFPKSDYEAQFEGKKKKAQYIKEFIADDNFYSLYDTMEQVDVMTAQAEKEKSMQQKAFDILFGGSDAED